MVKTYWPQQGDIVWVSFDPTEGHEQKGKRPAVIVSVNSYNKRSPVILFCPITNHTKSFPLEVPIAGKSITGYILPNHIRSLDWKARNILYIEKCSAEAMNTTLAILRGLIS